MYLFIIIILNILTSCMGEGEYPVIWNSDMKEVVFIVPNYGCYVTANRHDDRFIGATRDFIPYHTDKQSVEELIELCDDFHGNKISPEDFVETLQTRTFFIFPGTKWCGAGSIAGSYEDLGKHEVTDRCCREHDLCDRSIGGWSCDFNNTQLCNYSPFTRSHCDCDEEFRKCLLDSSEPASRRIGILYFTILGFKCFRKDYPVVRCKEYGGFLNVHCQQYVLNSSLEPIYQFFDNRRFE